jgi:hypothetical protein
MCPMGTTHDWFLNRRHYVDQLGTNKPSTYSSHVHHERMAHPHFDLHKHSFLCLALNYEIYFYFEPCASTTLTFVCILNVSCSILKVVAHAHGSRSSRPRARATSAETSKMFAATLAVDIFLLQVEQKMS